MRVVVGSSRAPAGALRLRSLRSNVSGRSWKHGTCHHSYEIPFSDGNAVTRGGVKAFAVCVRESKGYAGILKSSCSLE